MRQRLEGSSAIREAFQHAERLKREYGADQVFDLSIGNPAAPCPAGVVRALAQTVESSGPAEHGYMAERGYECVRAGIAASLTRRFGGAGGRGGNLSADDLVMTTGAACALNIVMRTFLDRDDEVIVFLPCYPAYKPYANNWGARIVEVPFEPSSYLPDLAAFEEALTPRTRMVIVNTPNNPTGLVWPPEVARGIADVLRRAQRRFCTPITLVSDEPYRELVYDGAENPWWPSLYPNTIVAYSFSKVASVAGERIGYVAVPPEFPEHDFVIRALCRALGDLGFVNAPATAQRIALACADETIDIDYYRRSRDLLMDGLVKAGFEPLPPNGAFYVLLPAPDGDEATFVRRLLERHVIVTPGSAFGAPGCVRLSYSTTPETIVAALPRFSEVARLYGSHDTEGTAS